VNAIPPTWGDLEFFLAAARGGSLAAAAGVLGVNASTVHRRIAKLEADLGTRLFDRSPRGYALTAPGEELLAHVLAMEEEVLALGRNIGGRDERLEGTVRVTTVDDLATRMLSPIFRGFRRAHPGVTIDVTLGADFADLARRQADVALRIGNRPTAEHLVVKHVSRVDVALYASRAYLRAHGRPAAPEDLARHHLVRGDAQVAGLPLERLLDRYGDPGRIAVRSNSMLARLAAIRDGLGIGFLGCFLGEGVRSLERLDLRLPEASTDLWMLVHVDIRRNARVRAFVDHVFDALQTRRAAFAHPGRGG
jgi:DNA-binding transcriptional LysR family regulator